MVWFNLLLHSLLLRCSLSDELGGGHEIQDTVTATSSDPPPRLAGVTTYDTWWVGGSALFYILHLDGDASGKYPAPSALASTRLSAIASLGGRRRLRTSARLLLCISHLVSSALTPRVTAS